MEPHCISDEQRATHIIFEAAAILIVTPFLAWLATRRELPPAARALSGGIAVVTVIVDGALLSRYLSVPTSVSGLGSTSRFQQPRQQIL